MVPSEQSGHVPPPPAAKVRSSSGPDEIASLLKIYACPFLLAASTTGVTTPLIVAVANAGETPKSLSGPCSAAGILKEPKILRVVPSSSTTARAYGSTNGCPFTLHELS